MSKNNKKARYAAISVLRERGVTVSANISKKDLSALLVKNGVASPAQYSVGIWYAGLSAKEKSSRPKGPTSRADQHKSADPFYDSWEWLTLRYKALLQFGRRCMCCGRTPEDGIKIHVDHIKPRRIYPDLELEITNLQILCGDCNKGKGGWDETDYRPAEPLIGCSACREREELYRLRYGKCPHCNRVLA